MDKIKQLLEQALQAEDHLTLSDKPEAAQALKFEHDGQTFEGWINKEGNENHVVLFKSSDDVDMYIEETCTCDDGAKALIVQMIRQLAGTTEEASDDEGEDDTADEGDSLPDDNDDGADSDAPEADASDDEEDEDGYPFSFN